jgi:hypothetical protein
LAVFSDKTGDTHLVHGLHGWILQSMLARPAPMGQLVPGPDSVSVNGQEVTGDKLVDAISDLRKMGFLP